MFNVDFLPIVSSIPSEGAKQASIATSVFTASRCAFRPAVQSNMNVMVSRVIVFFIVFSLL